MNDLARMADPEHALPAAAMFDGDADADHHFDPDVAKCQAVWFRVLVETIVDYTLKRCTSQDFKDAQQWLFYGEPRTPNSFESVCGYVGIKAKCLRPMVASLRTACLKRPDRLENLITLLQACGINKVPK